MWRDAFVNAGWINEDLQTALDYDLWIRIAKLRPLLKIEGYLATSRMYRGNKTIRMRGRVYAEIIKVVKAHYGFVPYDWVYGYASYIIDGKDQILETSRATTIKQAAALIGGAYVNWRQMARFWNEWRVRSGIGGRFTGRWDDGWISKVYRHDLDTANDCEQIVISGRHLLPFDGGLSLKIRLNGTVLRETALQTAGPFKVVLQCPPEARGRLNRLILECDKSLRPIKNGDDRPLSCLIDAITAERGGGPGE
jgi:hypothetical protein